MMRRHEFINEAVAAEILALIHPTWNAAVLAERLNDYHDYDIAQALEQLAGGASGTVPAPGCPASGRDPCPTATSREQGACRLPGR